MEGLSALRRSVIADSHFRRPAISDRFPRHILVMVDEICCLPLTIPRYTIIDLKSFPDFRRWRLMVFKFESLKEFISKSFI
jgi:hypothetical protein